MKVESSDGPTLRQGSAWIAIALGLNGLLTYGFLVVPARSGALDVESYGLLTTLWFLVFTVGTGTMVPLEQELTRRTSEAVHRQATHAAGHQRWFHTAVASVLLVLLCFSLAATVLTSSISSTLFRGEDSMVWVTLAALWGFAAFSLCRGWFAGIGRFDRYAVLIVIDAGVRFVFVVILIYFVGTQSASSIGLGVALGLGVAGVVGLVAGRIRPRPADRAAVGEFSRGWSTLSASQCLAQAVINGPVLLAPLLVSDSSGEVVGQIGTVLVLARAPMTFLPSVTATLLPLMTRRVFDNESVLLRKMLRQISMAMMLSTVIGGALAFAVGPQVVGFLFGEEFRLRPLETGLLAVGSVLFIWASIESIGLLAFSRRGLISAAWAIAAGAGAATTVLVRSDVALRLGTALVIASSAGVVVQRFATRRQLDSLEGERMAGASTGAQ